MPLADKTTMANLNDDQLAILDLALGKHLSEMLEQYTVNKPLVEDCRAKAQNKNLDRVQAATVILKEMWRRLRETHRLRVVK